MLNNYKIMAIIKHTTLTIRSTAFAYNEMIPSRYTCDGDGISPSLAIGQIPDGTRSLALIMEDPDAPNGTFVHWVMWNIPPLDTIRENSSPGVEGRNSAQQNRYMAPCPPRGVHHYHFVVYALDTKLDLPGNTDKNGLLKAMEKHILAKGELIGVYKR